MTPKQIAQRRIDQLAKDIAIWRDGGGRLVFPADTGEVLDLAIRRLRQIIEALELESLHR